MATFEKQVASHFLSELEFLQKMVEFYLDMMVEAQGVLDDPEELNKIRDTCSAWVAKKYLVVDLASKVFNVADRNYIDYKYTPSLFPNEYYELVVKELKLIVGEI
jgi:predicted membrane-bound dolichyl-phosphate-mannose-protein mannosyltransferase